MRLSLLASAAGIAQALPHDASYYIKQGLQGSTTTNQQEPCAQAAQGIMEDGIIAISTALDCLRSVPLQMPDALSQLDGMDFLIEYQSTLAYLADPPPSYPLPPTDIRGRLQAIRRNLNNARYTNEYDFQLDLYKSFQSAHDGHASYQPDITQIFQFGRQSPVHAIHSVSPDGLALPSIYLGAHDIRTLSNKSAEYTPSPISTVGGRDIELVINELAAWNIADQDLDSSYNIIVSSWPGTAFSDNDNSWWLSAKIVPPSDLLQEIAFVNGTTVKIPNGAFSSFNFTGVVDGETFFNKFCTRRTVPAKNETLGHEVMQEEAPSGQSPTSAAASPGGASSTSAPGSSAAAATSTGVSATSTIKGSNATTSSTPTSAKPVSFKPIQTQTKFKSLAGYPELLTASQDYAIQAYLPKDQPDLAILAIPSFKPKDKIEFSNVARQLLATAQQQNRTRLIIDLRDNGGGTITIAYDLVMQLFPGVDPYGGSNMRAINVINDIGRLQSAKDANVSSEQAANSSISDESSPMYQYNFYDFYNSHETLNAATGQPFPSWEAFFGPTSHHGDNFTNYMRLPINDTGYIGFPVANSKALPNITPPNIFDAKNILLVTNGNCASTCATFSEFMKLYGGVRSVAFGGRKQNGPMQYVGGVKGANEADMYSNLLLALDGAAKLGPEQEQYLNKTYGATYNAARYAIKRTSIDGGSPKGSVNLRNQVRRGDELGTPLQFVYEAADCRLFYTADQIFDQERVWLAAYKAMWNGGQCVEGSRDHPTTKVLVGEAAIQPFPSGANNTFGAAFLPPP